MRRVEQAEQRSGLLHRTGRLVEVVARQVGEAELALAREFPGEVEVDLARERLALRDQFGGLRLVEAHEDVRGLDLHTLAGVEFNLDRAVRLGHHPSGEELPGVIEESVIHPAIVAEFGRAPPRRGPECDGRCGCYAERRDSRVLRDADAVCKGARQ